MADFMDALESELRAVVQKYKAEIRRAYKSVRDPQALDERLDSIVAAVIKELEDAGYAFDVGAIDDVLYHLGRKISATSDGWSVVRVE
jgi:hypothetical protein